MRPALKPKRIVIERPAIERNPKLRAEVFARDGGVCGRCGRYDKKWIHDHKNPLWRRGADTLENSWTLCRHCEKPKTSRETTERAKADRLREAHERSRQRRSIQESNPHE